VCHVNDGEYLVSGRATIAQEEAKKPITQASVAGNVEDRIRLLALGTRDIGS
jgi:hypothetical protein